MSQHSEITAEVVESTFGQQGAASRFANFCNAAIVAETGTHVLSLPVLSEKPGADGGFDGEWDVPVTATGFANPFASIGWNVFQFKARGITSGGRRKAVSDLKQSVRGTLKALTERLETPKPVNGFVLFTNLQLGLETRSRTGQGAILSKDRAELETAVRKGSSRKTPVHIVDAAQLAALANKHAALRLTYFTPNIARSWDEKWAEEMASRSYKVSVALVGRDKEVEQLAAWIADASVRVIAICGVSGMGKTRLALEVTSRHRFRTTIVDVVAELERAGVQSLASSAQPNVIVVEDPSESQAIRLTKQAVCTTGVKVIFTFPSEARTPRLKLTEHDAVKCITLQPLDRERSRKLLELTGVQFDGTARDWITQQAGGVPEILLSAAELGPNLRARAGDLKTRLTDAYRKRVETELGPDAIGTLRLLSTLHWVSINGEATDLTALVSTVGIGSSLNRVLTDLKALVHMGFLRRRGDHVSVVPPLFAAALSEELFTSSSRAVCELFDKLTERSRKRLLERAVTVELPEDASFWDHVFDVELRTIERVVSNLDLLDYLARAIPMRTARFLAAHIEALSDLLGTDEHHSIRSTLLSTLRELAYTVESCTWGMRMLQVMAVREEYRKQPSSADKLFCECFVHWYYAFPLSFQRREQWIRAMLESPDNRERRLAAHAVVMITDPPHSLSGYGVHARRLGEQPPVRMWKEVHSYLDHVLGLRLELTQDRDSAISSLAQDRFIQVIQNEHLPPDQNVSALERILELQWDGTLNQDEREIREVIQWIERRYREASEKPGQAEYADRWVRVLDRLAALRRRFDEGPFHLRLKIALGRAFNFDWEEIDGKRVYGYEEQCRALADEAVANPEVMNDAAWQVLTDPASYEAHTFIVALGAADRGAGFLRRFEGELDTDRASHNYGFYLAGIQQHNPDVVDERLDELVARPGLPKCNLLSPITITGPSPGNRRRLLQMIAERSVEPFAVAGMFMSGRWLDDLPPAEVGTILGFVASGPPEWPERIVRILALYLHHDKPLPRELIPFAERALSEVSAKDDQVEWNCGRVAIGIARADPQQAFNLLRSRIAVFNHADRRTRLLCRIWMPFHRRGSNDFWELMRALDPERAYRELLELEGTEVIQEIGLVLDLERHREVLLNIARESNGNAVFLSQLVSGAQTGFFPFAYGLMGLLPGDDNLATKLAAAAVYQLGFGFGDGNYSQAMEKIDAELKSQSTPSQFRSWLENLKQRIDSAIKRDRIRFSQDHYLGWD